VGHQADNVAGLVGYGGDVVEGAVGIGVGGGAAIVVAVAGDDAAAPFEASQGLGVGKVGAVAVSDGEADQLAERVALGPGGVGLLDAKLGPLATKPERLVAEEGTGQEVGLGERIWKPLQMPRTGPPRAANSRRGSITGAKRAMAPQRR
jgi:hypothetical protein